MSTRPAFVTDAFPRTRRPVFCRRPVALWTAFAGVSAAALVGCGGTASTTATPGVATNPPQSDTATATSTGTGTPGAATASPGAPTQTSGIRTVISPLGLNLRDQPATTGTVIGNLAEGTVLTVLGNSAANGGWYQVKGETKTGWITAEPRYSTSRHLTSYSSAQHGFSTLYPDTWTFTDTGGASVVFAPQAGGGDKLTVSAGPTQQGLGAPGAPGYAVTSGVSVEVFGVTGTLRIFDRGGSVTSSTAPPGTAAPGSAAPTASPLAANAPHIAEILLTVNSANSMRIDFEYADPADLSVFTDIYNSMKIYAALPTPAPTAVATP